MLTNFSSSVCSSALDDEIYDVSTVTVGNTCWPAEPNDPKTKRVIGGLLPCCGRVMRRNRVWETCSDLFSKCFPSLFAGENRAEQVWRGCLISRVFKFEKLLCPWHKFRSEVWPLVWSKPYSKSLWNAASDVFFPRPWSTVLPEARPSRISLIPPGGSGSAPRVSSHLFWPQYF